MNINENHSPLKYETIPPKNKPDKQRQLWLLDNHPAFTGICPNCGFEYEQSLLILDVDNKSHHWNCPQCGVSYEQ
jgi:hypothetical protein